MKYCYQFFVFIYGLSIDIASLWISKAKNWKQGRKNQWTKLETWDNECKNENRIWMHCASSGEYQQGKPLLEKIIKSHKDIVVMVSFFSPSGYDQWKNENIADLIFYLPLDSKSNAKRLIQTLKPSIGLFVKNEFWFNVIDTLAHAQIPSFFISSVISQKDHIFFPFFIDVMKNVNHIFVQDNSSLGQLNKNGFTNASFSGDTRVDNVLTSKIKAIEFPEILSLKNKYTSCIIYGSIWLEDLKILYPFINKRKDILHIIAPHDVGLNNIKKCIGHIGSSFLLYSQIAENKEENILIIDSIGHLKSMYSLADIAYIGGGFGKGIHNSLEPASYFIPVIFGPKYDKFQEAVQFIEMGSAIAIETFPEFEQAFDSLLNAKESVKTYLAEYFNLNSGAAETIYKKISELGYV